MKNEELYVSQTELDSVLERYNSIYDNAPVAYITMDADSHIINANHASCQLLGVPRAELFHQRFAAMLREGSLPVFDAFMKLAIVSDQNESCEIAIEVEGQLIWILIEIIAKTDRQQNFHATIIDITERKRIDERLRLTAHVYETAAVSIMITDIDHNIIDVNDAFSQITGYSRSEVLGKNPRILQSGLQDKELYAKMWHTINTTGHWEGELLTRRKNGDIYPERTTVSAITDEKGVVTHYVGISSDITIQKQQEKQLEHIAHYDALTGIPNRALLLDRMQQAISQTKREQKLLAICYLDLDGFNAVNENLGYNQGDMLLIEVARRISQTLRGADTVARLNGDEFVVLLKGIENIGECAISLDRLLNVISQPIPLQEQALTITASIGVTLYPLDDEVPDNLIRHAEQGMQSAKQFGKNRYHIYDLKLNNYLSTRREHRIRIQKGLSAREFELFYQPKIDLNTNRLLGVEALIRWRHPERGLLLPEEFLPYIENCDLDIHFGEWVIETAFKQLDAWSKAGLKLDVSINISVFHLLSTGFVDQLHQKLTEHTDVWPNQLQIEILETAALSAIFRVSGIISACEALGVDFAIDDFGVGYSSLANLSKLPANTLKIDKSFVQNMLINKQDQVIVQGVIALARTFGLATVAEGIETEEQFQALSEMGCDIGQGYVIARPMPAAEIVAWARMFNPNHKDIPCTLN